MADRRKSDLPEDPKFKKVVEHFLKTPPQPRVKPKRAKPKQDTKKPGK